MDPSSPDLELAPLVETLVAATDVALRDRIVVELAAGLAGAPAAALWRPVPARGGATAWSPVASRGPVDRLPAAEHVEAAVWGALGPTPPGELVLVVGGARPLALALGGVPCDDAAASDARARVERALQEIARLEDTGQPASAEDAPPAPLPRRVNGAPGAPGFPGTPGATGAAGVRHDLRNLLAGLVATHDLARCFGPQLPAPERAEVEAQLARDCRRVGRLLAAALEPGHAAPQACRAADVVRDAVASERPACERAGVALAIERLDEDLVLGVDEVGLRRILQNLLQNAREACPRGSVVHVSVTRTDGPTGGGLVTVEDDGPGLAPEIAEHLFELGATHGKPAGNGLGLAVVREIARRAGGDVAVSAGAQGGARFEIRLPAP